MLPCLQAGEYRVALTSQAHYPLRHIMTRIQKNKQKKLVEKTICTYLSDEQG